MSQKPPVFDPVGNIIQSPIQVRCSSLPLISSCPAARHSDGVRLGGDTEESRLGSAVHELLAIRLGGAAYEIDSDAIAKTWDVDADELQMLAAMGWQVWQEVRQWFPSPTPEDEMRGESHGVLLTGHADVSSVAIAPDGDPEPHILDFKTGRLDAEHADQLRGYAWLALQETPEASSAWVCVVRVRDRCYDGASYTREELDSWFEKLAQKLHGPEYFNPGAHCTYCPRRATCPAVEKLLAQAYRVVCHGQTDAVQALSADPLTRGTQLAALLDAAKIVESLAEGLRATIKVNVQAAGGSMPTLDGRELVIREEAKRHIDGEIAIPLISKTFAIDPAEYTTVGKGKLEKAIRKVVPKGRGAAAIRDTMDQLSKAGAVTTTYSDKLEIHRNGHSNGTKAIGTGAGFDFGSDSGDSAT